MKIIIDDKIPYIEGAFEPVAEVVYLPGAKTTSDIVKDADAIVTRTRTICNQKLLEGSNVKFIATATIGYDHIDTDYCVETGIEWTNAPGCNSKSVEQYIASTLMVLAQENGWDLSDKCIGVVGVGNVGSKVARIAEIFGMKVLLNDPPRERAEGSAKFVSLRTVQEEADIISLHVPLNMKGEDSTFHLTDMNFLKDLKKCPVLINSCRGEVTDTVSVKTALKESIISDFICDCWENEPDLDLELLSLTRIATPHIAGYSKDGKATGSLMSVQAIDKFFGLGIADWKPTGVEKPEGQEFKLNGINREGQTKSGQEILSEAVLHTYDIRKDDEEFRKDTSLFEQLRGDYPVRREFPAFTIYPSNIDLVTLEKLKMLGFNVN